MTTPDTPDQPRGATVEYRYSSSAHGGVLAHLLTDIFDAQGRHYLHNVYGIDRGQADYNRVVRQRLGTGDYWFRYEPIDSPDLGLAAEDRPTMRSWVKERNGTQCLHVFNATGSLLWRQETDKGPGHAARQVVWSYRYDRDGALTASKSPEGVVRHMLTGRDHFLHRHRLERSSTDADELWRHHELSADIRRGFGQVLATVDRAARHTAAAFGWSERWGDVYVVSPDDVIVKYTYELAFGQLLTTSDPRTTTRSDPEADEPPEYSRLLTRYDYGGPVDAPTRDLLRVNLPEPRLPDGNPLGPVLSEILERDLRGRIKRTRDPVGVETTIDYFDDLGDPRAGFARRTTLDPGEPALGKLAIRTEYRVDDLGRVTAACTGPA